MSAVHCPDLSRGQIEVDHQGLVVNAEKLRAKARTNPSGGSPLPPAAVQACAAVAHPLEPGLAPHHGHLGESVGSLEARRVRSQNASPTISAVLVWIVNARPSSHPSRSSESDGRPSIGR